MNLLILSIFIDTQPVLNFYDFSPLCLIGIFYFLPLKNQQF